MATLTIRDLDDSLKARLRVQAAENGRSMESEVRAILRTALLDPSPLTKLGSHIHQRFIPLKGVELELPDRGEPARVVEL